MADNIKISGAGAPCDGEYSLLNEVRTGNSRVWMLGDNYRVYYHNGWKIANADITTIYYKLVAIIKVGETMVPSTSGAGILDPWETEDCVWVSTNEEYDPVPVVELKVVSDVTTETYTEIDEDGDEVVVLKTTNLSTGYVRYERVVTKTVYQPEVTKHDRFTAPMLTIGRVFQFRFVSDFFSLGYGPIDPETEEPYPLKGLYRVDKIFTFFDLLGTGLDLYKNLYEPLGLSEELYTTDFHKLGNTLIYKLVDVNDESIYYYMPMIFIDGTPNSAVNLYNKVLMSIDIGAQFDNELLKDIKDVMERVLMAKWGLTGKVNLAVYQKAWMPEDYYNSLVADRSAVKESIYLEHGNVLADTLFYVEDNKLLKERDALMAKLAMYEEILENQLA